MVTRTWNPISGEVDAGRLLLVWDSLGYKGEISFPKQQKQNQPARKLDFFFFWSSQTFREESLGLLCVLDTFWPLWWFLRDLAHFSGVCREGPKQGSHRHAALLIEVRSWGRSESGIHPREYGAWARGFSWDKDARRKCHVNTHKCFFVKVESPRG